MTVMAGITRLGKVLCWAACSLAVSGCSSKPTEAAFIAERNTADAAWVDCVYRAAIRFDDGKTDPVSIATGIAPQCEAQYNELTQIMVKQASTNAGRAQMLNLMRDNEIKSITSAILVHRAPPRN